jgi:2-amino-4-hydroxy-6-hydroxymethyldihydropteridine diphosphokinase
MMTRVILALGSNLGERGDTLASAVEQLVDHEQVRLLKVSPIVQTAPVGGPEQPDYLNMVIEVETDLEPYALLEHCQVVEEAHQRRRSVRWGPRTLDVDVITYGDVVSGDPELTIPHPRAAQRAFVLQPWAWMDSAAVLSGRPVAELAAEADDLPGLKLYEGDV